MSSKQQRVDAGVALLDRKLGRDVWLDRIDLTTLKVWSVRGSCVASQACGGVEFPTALRRLQVAKWDREDIARGFNARAGLVGVVELIQLHFLWKRTIRRLRAERAASVTQRDVADASVVVSLELLGRAERATVATYANRVVARRDYDRRVLARW